MKFQLVTESCKIFTAAAIINEHHCYCQNLHFIQTLQHLQYHQGHY